MKMKIFAVGIAAVTMGMLAPIPAMGVDKPSDSVSTSMTATPRDIIDDWHKPHPVPPLSGTMPTGTHPATAADMQKFVTKNWVSAVSTAKLDFTQSKLYKGNEAEFRTTFRKAEQKFNGNVPDTARTFGGGSTCRGSLVLVVTVGGVEDVEGCCSPKNPKTAARRVAKILKIMTDSPFPHRRVSSG